MASQRKRIGIDHPYLAGTATGCVELSGRGKSMAGKANTIPAVMEKLLLQEDGCCVWTGAAIHGYGAVHFDGRQRRVHRLLYEDLIGPIPAGVQLHHTCGNTLCANLAHLQPVTAREHM